MIDTLARAYRWSFEEIMRMTLPQIYMVNAACEYNSKRSDEYYEWKKTHDQEKQETEQQGSPFIPSVGKRLDEMNSDEIVAMNRRAMARMFAQDKT